MNGAELVGASIANLDCRIVIVNGKRYAIFPPTIHKLAGAGYYLAKAKAAENVYDIIASLQHLDDAAKALSWFIEGNESLAEELMEGQLEEVLLGITEALSLVDVKNFIMLSGLTRNAKSLIARPK